MSKVVCGQCKVDPELVEDGTGNAQAVCPRCGQRDDVNKAARIAGEHAMDQATRAFQHHAIQGAQRNEFIRFEANPLPNRTFRWHAA